jgi:hypothetical protein
MVSTLKISEMVDGGELEEGQTVPVVDGGANRRTVANLQFAGSWTTAGRPAAPTTPTIGFNTDTERFEFWDGSIWLTLSTGSSGGYTWNNITTTSATMVAANGYVTNNVGLVTLTLPALANVGDTFLIQGQGAGGWRIAQNAGQIIHFGAVDTTLGASGYLESTNRYDSIEVVCTVDDTEFAILSSPQGIITYV